MIPFVEECSVEVLLSLKHFSSLLHSRLRLLISGKYLLVGSELFVVSNLFLIVVQLPILNRRLCFWWLQVQMFASTQNNIVLARLHLLVLFERTLLSPVILQLVTVVYFQVVGVHVEDYFYFLVTL